MPALWQAVRGSVISVADPRYAWAAFYVWPPNASYARVVIVVTRCRNSSVYEQFHDVNRWSGGGIADGVAGIPNSYSNSSSTPATLEGQLLPGTALANFSISSYQDPLNITQYVYYLSDPNPGATNNPIATMAYLIIQNDTTNASATSPTGATNGFVFRIGNYDPTHKGWDLLPGNDLTGLTAGGTTTRISGINGSAYIVGRGYADPTNPGAGFDGPAQDVAAYTTFIPMN